MCVVFPCLHRTTDGPNTDDIVGVSSVECRTIRRPCQREAVRNLRLFAHSLKLLRPQLIYHRLALQIPDLDAALRGCTQPVSVGREAERVDDISSIKAVEALALG